MKLIAVVDIYNAKALKATLPKTHATSPGFKSKDILHRGCRFEVGSETLFDDLGKDEQEIVGGLVARRQVIFDDDANKEKIKVLDETIAKELAIINAAANIPKGPSQSEEVATAVINALVAAGVIKVPAPEKK